MTGLTDTLAGDEEYTIFAPTDAAFANIPHEALEDLAYDIPRLRNILLYHIVEGVYMLDDLTEQDQLNTLQGDTVGIKLEHGMDVNIAQFTQTDIEPITA